VLNALAESTELTRKQVSSVVDALSELIGKNISKKGPGVFVVPGLMKIQVVVKEATKAGMRPNPFKPGEMMKVPKPAPHRKVRAQEPEGWRNLGTQGGVSSAPKIRSPCLPMFGSNLLVLVEEFPLSL
jgi:hypothetical protein